MNRRQHLLCISLLALIMIVENIEASPVPVSFDKNAVQFIFTTLSDTDTNFRPGGTCFTVEVLTKHRPNALQWSLHYLPWINMLGLGKPDIFVHARYFVTAKHVLFDENGNFRPRLYLRADNLNGGVGYYSINASMTNGSMEILMSPDKSVDIAVIRPTIETPESRSNAVAQSKNTGPSPIKISYLSSSMILSSNKLNKLGIAEGDDMFFVGLFTPFYGSKENLPICRFGHLAMLPDEPFINGREGSQHLYLMETEAFGGNSGSPVFFSFPRGAGGRRLEEIKENRPFFSLRRKRDAATVFAGVLKGYFPDYSDLLIVNSNVRPIVTQNTGIAIVVPGTYLYEILFSKTEQEYRAEMGKMLLPKGYK